MRKSICKYIKSLTLLLTFNSYFIFLFLREEDNDDIVEILNEKCSRLKDMYGDYYISEILGRHPDMNRTIIVAEV